MLQTERLCNVPREWLPVALQVVRDELGGVPVGVSDYTAIHVALGVDLYINRLTRQRRRRLLARLAAQVPKLTCD
jgi:hypothetical protein